MPNTACLSFAVSLDVFVYRLDASFAQRKFVRGFDRVWGDCDVVGVVIEATIVVVSGK